MSGAPKKRGASRQPPRPVSIAPKSDGFLETRAADAALADAIRNRLAAGNIRVRDALRHLATFAPREGFNETWPLVMGDEDPEADIIEERKVLNDNMPFFSEAYLYQLVGKEDARTILSLLGEIARGIGLEGMHEVES